MTDSEPQGDEDLYDDIGCMCLQDGCPECGTECTWCGGEAYGECDDPIQCCSTHVGGWCPCRACHGTGLRVHQVVF